MEEALLLHARHRIAALAFTLSASALIAEPAIAGPTGRGPTAASASGEVVAHRMGAATLPFVLSTTPQALSVPSPVVRTAIYANPALGFGFGFGPNGLPICSASALGPAFFDGISSNPYTPQCSTNTFERFISQPSNALAPGENPNALYGRSFSPTNLLQ